MERNEFDETLNDYAYCSFENINAYSIHVFINKYLRRLFGINFVDTDAENMYESKYVFLNEQLYKGIDDYIGFFKRIGVDYKYEHTKNGDKFVVKIDDKCMFVFYPMCSIKYDENKYRLDKTTNVVTKPIEPVIVAYVICNGKTTRIDKMFSHEYISNINGCELRQYGWVNNEQTQLMDELDGVLDEFGLKNACRQRGMELVISFAKSI